MAMKHIENARAQELSSMNIEGINAFMKDLIDSNNEDAPMTCGFFRMEAGKPLDYTYGYDEYKLMLEGEITIAEKGGQTVTLKPGDLIFFEKGTAVTFSSSTSGTVFYVGQRKFGAL